MANTLTVTPLLTNDVLQAWDDVVTRQAQGKVATQEGKSGSVQDFSNRLKPIRHDLRDHVQAHSEVIGAYASLKIRLAGFWQRSPKGARFKDYIWMYAAAAKDKSLGRLQITFCPEGIVRSEYVSYPKTEPMRAYHIEHLSEWLQSAEWFSEFKMGCLSLPVGFAIQATTANGIEIKSELRQVTPSQWTALNTHGLDVKKYFVLAMDRDRDLVKHMTADELAELLVGDWAALSSLWPLLQGTGKSLAIPPGKAASPIVEATRRLTAPTSYSFTPESTGPRTPYTIANPISTTRLHGLIVNALSRQLEQSGYRVINDQARDIAILNSRGIVDTLFEVKTDSSTSSIYTGVGQLVLHSVNDIPEPQRVLVLPAAVNAKLRNALTKIGISILLYTSRGDESPPVFNSLEGLLLKK